MTQLINDLRARIRVVHEARVATCTYYTISCLIHWPWNNMVPNKIGILKLFINLSLMLILRVGIIKTLTVYVNILHLDIKTTDLYVDHF